MMWLLAHVLIITYGSVLALIIFYWLPEWMQGE